ncbi:hypothetical protein NH341_02445 [Tenacibaculum sp. XPcli2-G]|uniref:lanthionine synthetase LanC family protein n=1 Tax=Tenacibaculum sp. XPcli2-G TaxID=2954503 RepID=UPI002096B9BA|nr:lanthionine synthetase LanC family protein [Tenacibaculum sp. XPcli2-G]MCO7184271.1 hypothetical protein [Tenacibaculum sp. XPcli2-G]
MNLNKKKINTFLKKIEPILLEKSTEMHKPTLDADLGVLIFEATSYKYSNEVASKKKSLLLLNNLLNSFHEKELYSGFLEGFEGIFWVMNYLKECGVVEDEEIISDLLPYLDKSIEADIATNNFDLLHGSLNKLQYIIKSLGITNKKVIKCLDDFIDSLYSNREENESGIFWYDEVDKDEKPAINLGYAHGIPSLLVFLVRLKGLGYKKKELDILINGIIKSLNSFRFKVRSDTNYPDVFYQGENTEHISSRLGFCYGDLGIAYALSYAGVHLENKELISRAIKITNDVCRRIVSNSGMVYYEDYHFFDTAFCHGIAGIIYILIKIDKLLPSEILKNRIEYWKSELSHNLEIQLDIEGDIIFPSYLQPDDSNPYIIDKEALLMGYTGVGLVLLSLYYDKYDWSDIFLFY